METNGFIYLFAMFGDLLPRTHPHLWRQSKFRSGGTNIEQNMCLFTFLIFYKNKKTEQWYKNDYVAGHHHSHTWTF